MVDYVKLSATAKRLIEKNGRDLVLEKKSRTPADSIKSWRGPSSTSSGTSVTVKGVVVPPDNFSDTDGQLIRRGQLRVLISNESVDDQQTGLDITEFDSIKDGSDSYKIVEVNRVEPGALPLIYDIIVQR